MPVKIVLPQGSWCDLSLNFTYYSSIIPKFSPYQNYFRIISPSWKLHYNYNPRRRLVWTEEKKPFRHLGVYCLERHLLIKVVLTCIVRHTSRGSHLYVACWSVWNHDQIFLIIKSVLDRLIAPFWVRLLITWFSRVKGQIAVTFLICWI